MASFLLPTTTHTPQHSEIPMEVFKSRTFPRKTFCNTSSVLSRQECLLEELCPEGSSRRNGTLSPRYHDRAPRGLSGLVVAVLLPTPSAPRPLAPAELASSPASSPLPLRCRAACWGFVWVFFRGRVSSAAIKHRHSQDSVIVAPRWEVNSCCCIFLLPRREDDVRSLRQSIFLSHHF